MTTPVLRTVVTRDYDNQAFQPVQVRVDITIDDGSLFGSEIAMTVPASRRLVLEHIDGHAAIPSGQAVILARVETQLGGNTVEHFFVAQPQGSAGGMDNFTFNDVTLGFADPGTQVQVIINRNDNHGTGSAEVTLTGHFIDLTEPG